jgi:hypothetical protein
MANANISTGFETMTTDPARAVIEANDKYYYRDGEERSLNLSVLENAIRTAYAPTLLRLQEAERLLGEVAAAYEVGQPVRCRIAVLKKIAIFLKQEPTVYSGTVKEQDVATLDIEEALSKLKEQAVGDCDYEKAVRYRDAVDCLRAARTGTESPLQKELAKDANTIADLRRQLAEVTTERDTWKQRAEGLDNQVDALVGRLSKIANGPDGDASDPEHIEWMRGHAIEALNANTFAAAKARAERVADMEKVLQNALAAACTVTLIRGCMLPRQVPHVVIAAQDALNPSLPSAGER